MSSFPQRSRLLFGLEATDWLFPAGGVVLAAAIAAILVF
jgi:hypothetical protein